MFYEALCLPQQIKTKMKKLFYFLISILSLNTGCSSNSDYYDIDMAGKI